MKIISNSFLFSRIMSVSSLVIVQECGQTLGRVRVRTSIYCSGNY